ncbi:hypothetical protein P7K49_026956, partial [Saguinus oedipus]
TAPTRLLTPRDSTFVPWCRSSSPATYRLKIHEDFRAAASPRSAQTSRPSAPLPVGERLQPLVHSLTRVAAAGGGAGGGSEGREAGPGRARG